MDTLEVKGRGSLEQVASRSWSLQDALGPGRQRNDFQLHMRCPGRHRESLPCFLWHQEFDCPAAGKAQTSVLSSSQDEIPNLSAKRSSENILYVHTEMISLISKKRVLHSCCFTFHLSFGNEMSILVYLASSLVLTCLLPKCLGFPWSRNLSENPCPSSKRQQAISVWVVGVRSCVCCSR